MQHDTDTGLEEKLSEKFILIDNRDERSEKERERHRQPEKSFIFQIQSNYLGFRTYLKFSQVNNKISIGKYYVLNFFIIYTILLKDLKNL